MIVRVYNGSLVLRNISSNKGNFSVSSLILYRYNILKFRAIKIKMDINEDQTVKALREVENNIIDKLNTLLKYEKR
jgi:hypothetical protein